MKIKVFDFVNVTEETMNNRIQTWIEEARLEHSHIEVGDPSVSTCGIEGNHFCTIVLRYKRIHHDRGSH